MGKSVRNAILFVLIMLLATVLSGFMDSDPSTEEMSKMKDGIVPHVNRPDAIVQDSDATVYVNIKGSEFVPNIITVKTNTKVIWTNWHLNSPEHTVTSNDEIFESGTLKVGDTFSYIFKEPGEYDYRCTFHSYMKGTIIVEE
ncbi:MAG: cupredoxin domain-containing protein [Methanosarcinaceae archaeon]|nr:cupredoxin domain-containing protein [Methanosarcinaceae archaeon]